MLYRALGQTGESVSVIGAGGTGAGELRMGKVPRDGYRQKVYRT